MVARNIFCPAALAALLSVASLGMAQPLPYVSIWDDLPEAARHGPLGTVNPDARQGGVMRMGARGTFDNFNPHAARGVSPMLMALTFESLGEDVPGPFTAVRGLLAETFDVADDGKSMVVTLREAARFSDGTPVTAADVVYSFKALTQEATPWYRSYYQGIESVEAIDRRSVRFNFRRSDNRELPLIAAQLPVLPAAWGKNHNLGDPVKTPIPGSGPYRVKAAKMGTSIEYERNPDWWGRDLPINRGRYNVDGYRVEYYRDSTVMREAFFAGDIDYFIESTIKDWMNAYDVPAVREGRIVRLSAAQPHPVGMIGVFFNMRRSPLNDINVRRAVQTMFDFQWLNRALFYNAYVRTQSFFTGTAYAAADPMGDAEKACLASLPGINPADYARLATLPAGSERARMRRAIGLLAKAGYRLKDGKMIDKTGRPLTLKLLTQSPVASRLYGHWIKQLSRIGVTLELELVDQTQYVSRLRRFDYDMIHSMVRQSNNPGNEQRNFWSSAAADRVGSRNVAGVKMPAVDALIDKIARPRSKDDLLASCRVLDRLLTNQVIVTPGWTSDKTNIAWWKDRVVPSPALKAGEGFGFTAWSMTDKALAQDAALKH